MRGSQSLLGLVGLILLVFGGLALFFTGAPSFYVLAHIGLGIVLLVWFLVASFRDLGELLSARSTKYGANMVIYSLLFVALLVGINWIGTRHNKRFDLSESGVFSLSPQAKSVLDGVDSDIELQAFLEGGHDPQIESVLDSFQGASPHVKTKLIDPDKQPELAEKYAVRAYRTVRVEYKDQSTTVTQPSEESLTNAIIKVTHAKKQTVCFAEGQGEPSIDDAEDARGFAEAKNALASENYDVKKVVLAQEGKVPDDCNILVVAAPKKPLLEQEVTAISVFLSKGGKAVFMLPPRTGDELKPLLARYGVKLGDNVVVDQVVRLFQGPQLGLEPIVSTYGAHPITKDLKERTIFPLSRSVDAGETKPGLTVTSIAKTSASSWGETDMDRLFNQSQASLDPDDLKGPVSIAVAVDANLKQLGTGDGDARLVVFGTAGFADNKYLNMLFNRDLFLNTFGWLGSQEELLSIRPRTLRASRVQFSQDQATVIFYLSVLVLPELLLIAGLAVWWRRSHL
jgi:gliding motility-associatede transport system auxiliary component